jgi:carbamoyltransferase
VKQYGERDSAAAIQRVLEDVGVELVKNAIDRFGIRDFCFSGGCFANVQMNMRIFEETGVKGMYISPAMNDAGVAEGAAVMAAVERGWDVRKFRCDMPYFGPSFGQEDIRKSLKAHGSEVVFSQEGDWPERVAELVSKGNVVGFYHGNMEYGPRALGNRSVIADARRKGIKHKINTTIKRRKPYQPFCPSVLESERKRLFERSYQNRHMTCAFRLKEGFQRELPSGIHIDGTARPQFVERNDNLNYFRMISEFRKLTGFGFVINTSFNLHGRTIVMTPEDAIKDFLDCGLDYMAMDGWIIKRK